MHQRDHLLRAQHWQPAVTCHQLLPQLAIAKCHHGCAQLSSELKGSGDLREGPAVLPEPIQNPSASSRRAEAEASCSFVEQTTHCSCVLSLSCFVFSWCNYCSMGGKAGFWTSHRGWDNALHNCCILLLTHVPSCFAQSAQSCSRSSSWPWPLAACARVCTFRTTQPDEDGQLRMITMRASV